MVSIEAGGAVAMTADGPSRVEIDLEADLAAVANWWDPNLVSGLEPSGRLEARGFAELTPSAGLEAELVHQGAVLEVVGYQLAELGVAFREGRPSLWTSDPSWGRLAVDIVGPATASVEADFDEAPVDRLLSFTVPLIAAEIRGPATLSGAIDGTVSYPLSPETLDGAVDIILDWPDGRVALTGDGAGSGWQISKLSARTNGVDLEAVGRVDLGEGIEADIDVSVTSFDELKSVVSRWYPEVDQIEIAGGSAEGEPKSSAGSDDPSFKGQFSWSDRLSPALNSSASIFSSKGISNDSMCRPGCRSIRDAHRRRCPGPTREWNRLGSLAG